MGVARQDGGSGNQGSEAKSQHVFSRLWSIN